MVPREPRLAVRRHRKVVVVLAISIALALSCLGIESASASTRSTLALSLNPDRSNAVRLQDHHLTMILIYPGATSVTTRRDISGSTV